MPQTHPDAPVAPDVPALRGLAAASAGLTGFGLVLWIAANWDALGRTGQFTLLQAAVLGACALAWRLRAARPAAGLLALLGIGGLFAYFGQTYQTGADAWQRPYTQLQNYQSALSPAFGQQTSSTQNIQAPNNWMAGLGGAALGAGMYKSIFG